VLVYEAWDAALEPCQRRWLHFADGAGLLEDGAAVMTPGRRWT
jgi:hypothetical protein